MIGQPFFWFFDFKLNMLSQSTTFGYRCCLNGGNLIWPHPSKGAKRSKAFVSDAEVLCLNLARSKNTVLFSLILRSTLRVWASTTSLSRD